MSPPLGTFCLVLHSHLPWLAHHGTWPVGEEWLHQAWTRSYLPLVRVLRRLADDGHRDVLTLGVTPVLLAMLDDAWCSREVRAWVAARDLRVGGVASRPPAARGPALAAAATTEHAALAQAAADLEGPWRAGASPVLRGLADDGVVELLGGPLTHPVLPLLRPRVAAAQLAAGLEDARHRLGEAPRGVWAPECAYAPGLEDLYAAAGVQRLLLDGPTAHGARAAARAGGAGGRPRTADLWTLGDSGVVVAARDLDVTYRVWSPTAGYPGGPWYRDFHTFDHWSGLQPARVTRPDARPHEKAPYEPAAAARAVAADAEDFVAAVVRRLEDLAAGDGRPGVVVVAFDTELFGHWWHEGPAWLESVLRALPGAGVRTSTLRRALEDHGTAGALHPQVGSWGLGKDLGVWSGPAVADLADQSTRLQDDVLVALDARRRDAPARLGRDPARDQLVRELFLATSSDWAFAVSHGSAPDYFERRQHGHDHHARTLLRVLADDDEAAAEADRQRAVDGPVGPWLDARVLSPAAR